MIEFWVGVLIVLLFAGTVSGMYISDERRKNFKKGTHDYYGNKK